MRTKKKYGLDVYISSGISVPVYGFVLFVLLKKFNNGSLSLDPLVLAAILAGVVTNLNSAVNMIRVQWQTNKAHQRINQVIPPEGDLLDDHGKPVGVSRPL